MVRKPTIWGRFMIWEGRWVKVYTSWIGVGAWLKWSENRHNIDAPPTEEPDEPRVYIQWMDGHSPIPPSVFEKKRAERTFT